jgi:hypothetical protein
MADGRWKNTGVFPFAISPFAIQDAFFSILLGQRIATHPCALVAPRAPAAGILSV